MKNTKLLCILLALCTLTLVLTACGEKKETVVNEPVQTEETTPVEEEPVAQIANPIVEYDTVEDAVIKVGHLSSIPSIYARYNQSASVIADTLIQIVFSDDVGPILMLREQAGNATDISGDYYNYEYTDTFESNGHTVTVKGESSDAIKAAFWNDGAYAHSLSYVNGVTLEEVTAAVNEII